MHCSSGVADRDSASHEMTKESDGAVCAGRTVAPFNEPSTIYWWAGNNQEGCHFDAATQNLIIEKLAARLRDSGLAAAGVEVSAVGRDLHRQRACSRCTATAPRPRPRSRRSTRTPCAASRLATSAGEPLPVHRQAA